MRKFCCNELEKNLSGVNGQGAGLHALEVMNAKTLRKRFAAVYLRAERKRRKYDAGVVIRWCPFCRADLEEWFRQFSTQAPAIAGEARDVP
jgi:hypothetical protein